MAEVDLTLQTNIADYLKQLMQASKANEDFFRDFSKLSQENGEDWQNIVEGMQQELKKLGISEEQFLKTLKDGGNQQIGILEDLQEQLKLYQQARLKATNVQDVDKFNKKISETQKEITKLTEGTKKTGFSLDALKSGFLKFSGIVAAVAGAVAGFTAVIKRSQEGAEFLERKIAGLKASFSVLTGELTKVSDATIKSNDKAIKWGNVWGTVLKVLASSANFIPAVRKYIDGLTKKMNDAAVAAENYTREQQKLDDLERDMIVTRAEANKKIAEAKLKYEDNTLSIEERIAALKEALTLEEQTANNEVEHQNKVIANLRVINSEKEKTNSLTSEDKLLLQQAIAKGLDLETASMIKRRKLRQTLEAAEKELNRDRLENEKKFLDLIEQLYKKASDAQVEALTGRDKINAIEKNSLAEVDALETQLKKLGTLTKDQYGQLEILRTSIKKKAIKDRLDLDREEESKAIEQTNKDRERMLKNAETEIELLANTDKEKLQMQVDTYSKMLNNLEEFDDENAIEFGNQLRLLIKNARKELANMPKEEFSIWKLLGIDTNTEEGKAQVDAIKESLGQITDAIKQTMDAELALAEQRTQILDERLSDLESQLDEEKQLREDGFANNVDLVEKEIKETKAQKEKALKEEQKIKEQALLLDTAVQLSSLITASANIYKSLSAIPFVGVPLAIAAIALMFGTFASAKIKAAQAIKMEKGGYIDEYGVVKGKRHSEGGEPLGKHVEIESGEGLGVFNRSATSFYGDRLPQWVSDINAKEFPKFDINRTQSNVYQMRVEKLEKELKDVNEGIRLMNENLINQSQDVHTGRTRIEKRKNFTRIIHVNR